MTEAYKKVQEKGGQNLEEHEKVLMDLRENFQDDKICIFPSFFKFLIYLRKNGIEFGLVFRTFGIDLPMIQKEMNYFVSGQHPFFDGRNGTPHVQFDEGFSPRSFILKKENTFKIYRTGLGFDQVSLFKGISTVKKTFEQFMQDFSTEIKGKQF